MKTRQYHKNNLQPSVNGIPYITRKSVNNGLKDLVKFSDDLCSNSKNTITLGGENADFFYQPYEYVTGNNMCLISHDRLNRYNGLFLVNVFRQSIKNCGFGFGLGLTGSRFLRRLILLPVDSSGEPNWKFMEDYVRVHEQEKKCLVLTYCKAQLARCLAEADERRVSLEAIEWKAFKIEDVFEVIERGKRLTKKQQEKGNIPYVSSSAFNNGVDNFISNEKNVRRYKNALTVANSGSVASSFYHPYEYVASDHVTNLKISNGSREVYLFISVVMQRLKEKYSFNREMSDDRIKKDFILLPASPKGEPNFHFMKQFILQEEARLYQKIIKRLLKKNIIAKVK